MKIDLRIATVSFVAVVAACALSYLFVDIPLLRLFQSTGLATLRRTFEVITRLGVSTPWLVLSAIAAVWFRYVKRDRAAFNTALFVFAAIALSGLAADLLKFLLGRYRPVMFLSRDLYGFRFFSAGYSCNSFPSGHANTITALLMSLYLVFSGPRIAYVLVAVPVIMSRVIIGAHFLSDALFGTYLAILTTLILREIFERHGLSVRRVSAHAKQTGRFFRRNFSSLDDSSERNSQ